MIIKKSQSDPWIQVYVFQIIDDVYLWNCIKKFFEWVYIIKSVTGLWKIMTFQKKMLDSKIFITTYTERGIVIREEIRMGNFSVSNSASKKNCLITAVWQRQRWWHIKRCVYIMKFIKDGIVQICFPFRWNEFIYSRFKITSR
jgi:hypothetical protein